MVIGILSKNVKELLMTICPKNVMFLFEEDGDFITLHYCNFSEVVFVGGIWWNSDGDQKGEV